MSLNIVFKNAHFVAADKPALSLTVPPRFPDEDARPVLGMELQTELKTQVYPVHRLDYGVSGLTLFALSEAAHRAANTWFEHRGVKKVYQAITTFSESPPPLHEVLEWKCRLLRGKKRAYEHPTGKSSLTHAKCVAQNEQYLLWHLEPLTGRPHQLRYELFRHGYPIVGDTLYGGNAASSEGIQLRASQIEFLNPEAKSNWQLPLKLEVSGLHWM